MVSMSACRQLDALTIMLDFECSFKCLLVLFVEFFELVDCVDVELVFFVFLGLRRVIGQFLAF